MEPPAKKCRFSSPHSPTSMEKICEGYVPKNTSKSTSWALRVFRAWREQRNEHEDDKCPETLLEEPQVFLNTMCSEAGIHEKETNHSLRATGASALFNAGVPEKLIRDVTGHRSSALHLYERPTIEQKQSVSKVLVQGDNEFQKGKERAMGRRISLFRCVLLSHAHQMFLVLYFLVSIIVILQYHLRIFQ